MHCNVCQVDEAQLVSVHHSDRTLGDHFLQVLSTQLMNCIDSQATIRASDGATITAFLPPGEVCEE